MMHNQQRSLNRVSLVILMLLLAAAAVWGCGQKKPENELEEIWKDGVMKVGFSTDYPLENTPGTGAQITGFEMDMFEEIAKRMGVRIEFIEMPADSLIPAVNNSEVDVAVGTFQNVQQVDHTVDFADPYFKASLLPGELPNNPDKGQDWSVQIYAILPGGAKEMRLKLNEVMGGMIEEGFIDRLAEKHNLAIRTEYLN